MHRYNNVAIWCMLRNFCAQFVLSFCHRNKIETMQIAWKQSQKEELRRIEQEEFAKIMKLKQEADEQEHRKVSIYHNGNCCTSCHTKDVHALWSWSV